MNQHQLHQKDKPKILFVDDEESILSAAKRLLRGRNIEVLTTTSAQEAIKIAETTDCWVVVSDYRMPTMTGTELLEKLRKRRPHISRILLTGFLEMPIIQEAINKASVFRFITKPWDESDLLLGLETAIQHSQRQRTNAQLIHEVGTQNQRLEQLTQNLENEVIHRTQGIEESKKMAESKQKLVRDLTSFVKNLSTVADLSQLYEVLYYEFRKHQGVSAPYVLVLESPERGKLFWMQARNLHEKIIHNVPKHFESLSLRTDSEKDKKWWIENIKKECRNLIVLPIRARESGLSQPISILFLEHGLEKDKLGNLLDRLTERIQPVSIVLDKILLREQLMSATQQWEATFNGFKDPIAVVDNQERVVRANKSFMKPDRGERCHEMFNKSPVICEGCPMPSAALSMDPASAIVRSHSHSYRVRSYPVVSKKNGLDQVLRIVNHYSDISHERELYMKLVQSEKLAAVGLLAGNIAHELNNPLSGITALAQILKSELKPTEENFSDLVEIEKAAQRCQLIIKNLLSFSEPSTDHLESVDLNELIQTTLPLLKTALRSQSLHTFYDKKLKKITVQPSQLQQVIFNLVNNACQAMVQGGRLTIKTWNEGRFVCFSVTDTGSGIPSEIQERIFEPFFTTKAAGVGTGLGLSVSLNIVEKLNGEMSLSSQSQGTTFTVRIPSGKLKQE